MSTTTMATASYDGTCKIWHTPTMECTTTMAVRSGGAGAGLRGGGKELNLYCVSWAPSGEKLVCSTSVGVCIIWDAVTGKQLAKTDFHK